MTILSGQSLIRTVEYNANFITPFSPHEVSENGTSWGISPAGYVVRIAQDIKLPPRASALVSTIEQFSVPRFLKGRVLDKSSWARQFLSVFNTVLQPGWAGYLTLELVNHGPFCIDLKKGMGIAEVEFMFLDQSTEYPYKGRYQDQVEGPQPAKME